MGSVISLKPGFHRVQIQYLDLNAESRFKCKFNAFICWQFRRDRTGHWDFIEFATADSEIALHTQYLQWKWIDVASVAMNSKSSHTHTGLVTQQMLLCRYSSVFENMTSGFDESGLKLVFQGCSNNSTTIIFNLITYVRWP